MPINTKARSSAPPIATVGLLRKKPITPRRTFTGSIKSGNAARSQSPGAGVRNWGSKWSIANPRIEHGVGDVDHQVDQRIEETEHQHDALNHRIVAAQD